MPHVYTSMCVQVRGQPLVLSPQVLSTLVFETGSFTSLELANKARLTGWPAWGSTLLCPLGTGIISLPPCHFFFLN